MKWLARVITLVLYIVYGIGALLLAAYTKDSGIPVVILSTVTYALFMIVSMGTLFETFPEPLQKYFRNKTEDNPDGCGI